jgi:hypothetical protein
MTSLGGRLFETVLRSDDLKIDHGQTAGGSFVRVTHLPTGRRRFFGPLVGEKPEAVVARLRDELETELRSAGQLRFLDS